MTVTTHGIRVRSGSHAVRTAVELLSSMRFSISLLTVICIASVIGTVLKQHEPLGNYVNQFGPFWAGVFGAASLYTVYGAWWFLLILAFLVTSTSLCVARNTPKIIADLKTVKEDLREQSLKAFGHRAEGLLAGPAQGVAQRIGEKLASAGWKVRIQQREQGFMVAARAGGANKLGYIAAHSAIILVCIGGLLDGDLVVRAQMLLNGKTPYAGGGMIADVRPEHRLSENNPTFRGNILVAEGTRSGTAILNQSDGILLQELPFVIELKKFIVEYYSTGMPKLFASDIVIHDKESGAEIPARVEVNHPASYKGVEIYQSSFDDGGSTVKFRSVPMTPSAKPFEIEGVIGASSQLTRGQGDGNEKLTLEYTGLRVINVENFGGTPGAGTNAAPGADARGVDFRESLDSRLGAANKTRTKKELRNVGPSVSYKLRDAAGQAREFNNYMLPVDMGDGATPVFLLGERDLPDQQFRYLRIPADEQSSMDGFMRLRDALADGEQRERAVKRYAARAVDPAKPELAQQLTESAKIMLALFAGVNADGSTAKTGGLQAISDYIEARVPAAERSKAGDVLVRILNGVLFEMLQMTREQAKLAPLEPGDKTQAFMTQAVLALSDAFYYPAPMAFMLKDFTQVQASVFQVTRAPGRNIVYLGCALLILGVFAMLYVRERRLWVWLTDAGGAQGPEQARAVMALSTNRKTMDGDREFEQLKAQLLENGTP